jgi:hypothetical protein
MRAIVLSVVIAAVTAAPCLGQERGSGAAPPAPAAAPADTGPGASATNALPVRRVVLYKNGVGYFEHLGRVRGNQAVTIDFTSGQLNDVLKSLTTLDLGNGRITGITYNSDAPLGRQIAALGLPIGEVATIAQFYGALRGARLEAQTPAGAVAGRLLSVEKRTRTRGAGVTEELDELAIVTDAGEVRLVELSPLVTVRFADRELQQQLSRYLAIIGSALRQTVRRMTVTTAGAGDRPLFVSYVSEVPVWKTTYRLVVPSKAGAKPFLQGWAIVDNTVGENWVGVEMSLVAGAPQSFIQQISQPYYLRRPVVPLPQAYQLQPQTHQAALSGGSGTVTGKVTDTVGGVLPGVSVRAVAADGSTAGEATTDANGTYVLRLQAGSYTLQFTLAGFKFAQTGAVEVGGGGSTEEDKTLQVGGLQETVRVEAGRPKATAAAPTFRTAIDSAAVVDSLAGLEAAASGRELGDLFEYRIKEPVTILKNQSAMVPILNSEVAIEKVTLWNPARRNAAPLRAAWLTNSTGLTLDGGSFTVLEADAFAGEGLMNPLQPGERRLLSYAADAAVRVDVRADAVPRRVERVRIERGTIVQSVRDEARSVYTVRNEDTSPRSLVIEHPARAGWTLSAGTPQPVESSSGFHRFRLAIEPKKTATLTVDESHPLEQRVLVSSLTDDQVVAYVRGPWAGTALEAALKPVLEKKQAIAAIDRELAARRAESDRITADQERVRENMKALKGTAEERALVQRYARQLDEQETRMETLRRETIELERQRSAAQTELDRMIEGLTLEEVRR